MAAPAPTEEAGPEDDAAFAQSACERPDVEGAALVATAHYQDVPAVVLAAPVPEGTRILVLAADDCRQLADVIL